MIPFKQKPDVIVFVSDSDVSLWQAGDTAPALQLSSTDERLGQNLVDALLRLRARRALLLLDITDIHLQVETLPRAGLLDRAKVAARRSHFLYPSAELRRALRLPDTPGSSLLNYLFAAVPNHAQIAAIYNSLARAQVWLQNVLLFPIEYWGLLWPTNKHTERHKDIVLLNMGTHVRLLAIENDTLHLSRTLAPMVADRPDMLQQEIQTTQSYMLRKGWNKDAPWHLSAIGLALPKDFASNLGANWRYHDPGTNPQKTLISALLNGERPACPLVSTRMRQRQWLLRTNNIVQRAIHIAAALTALVVAHNALNIWHTEYQTSTVQHRLADLPGFNQKAQQEWAQLLYWRNTPHPLQWLQHVATNIPPAAYLQTISWNCLPPEQGINSCNAAITLTGVPSSSVQGIIANLKKDAGYDVVQERSDSQQQTGEVGGAATETPQAMYYLRFEGIGGVK